MMENFRDIAQAFLERQALIQVKDESELLETMRDLLKNPEKAQALGKLGKDIIRASQGATQKNLEIISSLLKKS